MVSTKVKLRTSAIDGSEGVLVIQLISNRRVKVIKTAFNLYPHEWDKKNEQVCYSFTVSKARLQYLRELQAELNAEMLRMRDIVRTLEKKDIHAVDEIAHCFAHHTVSANLFQYMEQQSFRMQLAGQGKSASMIDTARRSFTSFLQESDIRLSLINAPLIKQYESFLLRKNLALNTISCYMRILRSVYNKAVEEGLSPQRVPFKKVYTGIAKTNKRSVDENVIQRLQRFDLAKLPKLAFARDLFMFSFYTRGMSFVDMANLTSGNLQDGYLFYTRSKTGGLLSIKVEPCIEEIIERHKVFAVSPYLLPIRSASHPDYSNRLRVYNKRLKRISLLMGLERPLSSYASRHSWATIALRRGVSIRVISESMGHADESTTRIYLASLGQDTIDKANEEVIRSFF